MSALVNSGHTDKSAPSGRVQSHREVTETSRAAWLCSQDLFPFAGQDDLEQRSVRNSLRYGYAATM